MNTPTLHRRAIRDYDEIRRLSIASTERETFLTTKSAEISSKSVDAKAPEPCNFCAPDELVPATDRFGELAQVLGPYWLVWLIAFAGLCIVSAALFVALICVLVAP